MQSSLFMWSAIWPIIWPNISQFLLVIQHIMFIMINLSLTEHYCSSYLFAKIYGWIWLSTHMSVEYLEYPTIRLHSHYKSQCWSAYLDIFDLLIFLRIKKFALCITKLPNQHLLAIVAIHFADVRLTHATILSPCPLFLHYLQAQKWSTACDFCNSPS